MVFLATVQLVGYDNTRIVKSKGLGGGGPLYRLFFVPTAFGWWVHWEIWSSAGRPMGLIMSRMGTDSGSDGVDIEMDRMR